MGFSGFSVLLRLETAASIGRALAHVALAEGNRILLEGIAMPTIKVVDLPEILRTAAKSLSEELRCECRWRTGADKDCLDEGGCLTCRAAAALEAKDEALRAALNWSMDGTPDSELSPIELAMRESVAAALRAGEVTP